MKLFLCTIPKNGVNTPSLALGYLQAACKEQNIEVELRDFNYELWQDTIHTEWWEIWKESKVLNDLRDKSKLKGKCGKCRYNEVCSGSRCHAYSKTGDYLAEDPICWFSLDEINSE